MKKIWLVINNGSYRKKQKIYKTETALLKALNPKLDQEIFEFDLVSSVKSKDYINAKNRDTQLRAVLGELDEKEESAIQLIQYYEKVAPDGRLYKKWRTEEVIDTQKKKMIAEMEKFQTDKKAFSSILVKHKKYLMTVCSDVEWYRLLLSCHNFRSHVYSTQRWTYVNRERVPVTNTKEEEEMVNNFKEAKKLLKKKKAAPSPS